jgi:hypothetical protein
MMATADGPIKTFPFRGIKATPPYMHQHRPIATVNFGRERKIMSIRNCVLAGALIWTTVVFAESAVRSAHTDIVNAQGQKIGTVTIREAGAGIRFDLRL